MARTQSLSADGRAAAAAPALSLLTLHLSPPALERAYWETSPVLRTLDWVGLAFGILFLVSRGAAPPQACAAARRAAPRACGSARRAPRPAPARRA